ncbi:hypothetical protein DFAR_340034 [Desulfarculales bacterium]
MATLAKKHGKGRVEAVCLRDLAYRVFSSKSVERIIDKELDKAPLLTPDPEFSPTLHSNIRGAGYFLTVQGGSHAGLIPSWASSAPWGWRACSRP